MRGDERTREYRDQMSAVKQYTAMHAIPRHLRDSMREHVELHFQVEKLWGIALAGGRTLGVKAGEGECRSGAGTFHSLSQEAADWLYLVQALNPSGPCWLMCSKALSQAWTMAPGFRCPLLFGVCLCSWSRFESLPFRGLGGPIRPRASRGLSNHTLTRRWVQTLDTPGAPAVMQSGADVSCACRPALADPALRQGHVPWAVSQPLDP